MKKQPNSQNKNYNLKLSKAFVKHKEIVEKEKKIIELFKNNKVSSSIILLLGAAMV